VQDLAIQWDIAVETISVLENPNNEQGITADAVATSITELSDQIPDAIELGLHICYGDRDHRHFIEPSDFGVAVAFVNRLAGMLHRSVGWVHMPVPRERDDDGYFAPLQNLRRASGSQFFLGLVHLADGIAGATRRMTAANRFVKDYGIAAECGLGRRPAEAIPALLALHRQIAMLNV